VTGGRGLHRLARALWYQGHPLAPLLAPAGWAFCAVAMLRRELYGRGLLPVRRLDVPVIVVGNINAGGTGKTPLVIWVAQLLAGHGYRPGIVTRGYGGRAHTWPQQVRADSDPRVVGDEALLLARHGGCPVAAAPDRPAAALALREQAGCDVIVSDDGLQHYALGRDIEVAVIDGARGFGNRRCLPAGPLRETVARLRRVDLLVRLGKARRGEYWMRYRPGEPEPVAGGAPGRLADLAGSPVHAVAGIGHPERFFALLRGLGLAIIEHPFPDHHPFRREDLEFGDALPVVMTEKDAVKCRAFAGPRQWCVPIRAEVNPAFATRLLTLLEKKRRG
jgi:tetraacyldisaccharide 4'-kinase